MLRYSPGSTALAVIAGGLLLAGCASQQQAQNDVCPPNKTLVCKNRMGQDQECKCHSKATMRDIFDLRRSR